MAKKTIEQLEQEARKAEARARKLREQARKQTLAETAKLNAEIIKAVDEWRESVPTPIPREDLPKKFREWAKANLEKRNVGK